MLEVATGYSTKTGDPIYALDFSFWKRPYVRQIFSGRRVLFVASQDAVPPGNTLVIWGMRDAGLKLPESVRVLRIEDGFLRSVGLGADLIRPISWVVDDLGIYYDATRPSRLERLLADTEFSAEVVDRAAALTERLVASGLTKYNVGAGSWRRPADGRRVILVPGQVETDASITYGAPAGVCVIRRNMDLLQAVREANPEAWLVYKPHPDVLAGLRLRGNDEDMALRWCDEQIIDVPMGELLGAVDEVHVLTSLSGFEALLRGKKVTCYGQPFYAGWGLTTDIVQPMRRTRSLTLDELVAGALISYPSYMSLSSGELTTPEQALDDLLAWRNKGTSLPWWRKPLRWILRTFYKR